MAQAAAFDATPQHIQALRHANRIRLARAELKRRVAAGRVTAGETVQECPFEAESMSVSELLMSQKRWGRARCRRLLVALAIPENKAIGTLTQRQRQALVAALAMRGAGQPAAAARQEPAREPALALV